MARIEPFQDFDTRKAARARVMKVHAPARQTLWAAGRVPQNQPRGIRGAAIISVLLVLTVLTIMVVAFLQSMRIDRLTARAYLNKTKAEMLARAATQTAIKQIISNTRNPATGLTDLTYTIESAHPNTTASTSPDYTSYSPTTFISRYDKDAAGNLRRKASPLISTTIPESDFQTGIPADFNAKLGSLFNERTSKQNTTDLNINGHIQSIATGINANYYRVPLLDYLNAANVRVGRYGFMVLDEQARLNPALHISAVRDNYAQNAQEIPISTGGDVLLNPAELASFLANPTLPASPFSIGQFFSTNDRAKDRRHLFGYYDVSNNDVIPAGYPDAGKPKYNINILSTDTAYGATPTLRAENIATIIDNNLPNFKLRDPSLASESAANQKRYLNRLAASIVDYIDTDTNITTVNGGEPAGRDLFPLTTAIAEQVRWTSEQLNPGTGLYEATLQTILYVQIWNPYTVPVTGSAKIILRNRMRVNYGTGLVLPLNDYNPSAVSNITVRPNEFVVVTFPAQSQTFTSPTGPSTPRWVGGSPSESADQTTHLPFEFEWNGLRVDMSRRSPVGPGSATSGLTRNSKTFALNATHYQASFIPTQTGTAPYRFVGDPRATYLTNYDWGTTISSDATYGSGTRWKGRQSDTSSRYQDFVLRWNQRDYIRANPVFGTTPGSINTSPASVVSPYVETVEKPNAPFYIRNANMLSIAELGHIFDPAQADDLGAAPSGGTPSSIFVSGGGRSLRIGQPEFSYYNSSGKRAMELLDLFTTNVAPITNGYPEYKGRININTASVEVLQALFYNIAIKSDEGFHQNIPANISTVTESKAKILADAIVKDRKDNGYYTKISDLYRIFSMTEAASSNPAWNRAETYQPKLGANAGANTPPEVMDRAREELFAKTVNLIDTQSRSFRIYSTGQVLNPSGQVIARSFLETILTLQTSINSSGVVTITPKVIHELYY